MAAVADPPTMYPLIRTLDMDPICTQILALADYAGPHVAEVEHPALLTVCIQVVHRHLAVASGAQGDAPIDLEGIMPVLLDDVCEGLGQTRPSAADSPDSADCTGAHVPKAAPGKAEVEACPALLQLEDPNMRLVRALARRFADKHGRQLNLEMIRASLATVRRHYRTQCCIAVLQRRDTAVAAVAELLLPELEHLHVAPETPSRMFLVPSEKPAGPEVMRTIDAVVRSVKRSHPDLDVRMIRQHTLAIAGALLCAGGPPEAHCEPGQLVPRVAALAHADARYAARRIECGICLMRKPAALMYRLMHCGHVYCLDCLRRQLETKIGAREVVRIVCPHLECDQELHYLEIKHLLERRPDVWTQYDTFLLLIQITEMDGTQYCPHGCGNAVQVDAGPGTAHKGPKYQCTRCGKAWCLVCKIKWHDELTCEQFARMCELGVVGEDPAFLRLMASMDTKRCPNARCRYMIVKDSGCNRMHCSRCRQFFCWICGQTCEDQARPYAHFRRSGATCRLFD